MTLNFTGCYSTLCNLSKSQCTILSSSVRQVKQTSHVPVIKDLTNSECTERGCIKLVGFAAMVSHFHWLRQTLAY